MVLVPLLYAPFDNEYVAPTGRFVLIIPIARIEVAVNVKVTEFPVVIAGLDNSLFLIFVIGNDAFQEPPLRVEESI